MSSTLKQDQRILSLTTPLGEDVLAITRFDGHEALSELFEFRLDAVSLTHNIDFDAILGRNSSITLKGPDGQKRIFNGVVAEARWAGTKKEVSHYSLVLRPWLWLLSYSTNCRIFAQKTVPDIIGEVFKKNGFTDFRLNLTNNYDTLEYCVQYRESDMNFVCRLMEENGIYYYFKHSSDKHEMVLADAISSHVAVPEVSSLAYLPSQVDARRDVQLIEDWSSQRGFQSGKVFLKDYDHLKAKAKLEGKASGQASYEKGDLEIYDYHGRYTEEGEGERRAKLRLQAEQARDHHRVGTGIAPSLYPGGLTTLDRHPTKPENREYLVLACKHSCSEQGYGSGASSSDMIYTGAYEFAPSSQQFRAPLITPKPVVRGPQTAVVVGSEGEEIDVDEHGRILVQFFWDRDKTPSRRARVAQIWSGNGWGGIVIPRVGQEVVVQFLEGDPDYPIVVGTVYNSVNKLPYDLPANKTISGVKSETYKGSGYNEFILEDKKGEELIRAHAQKDLDVTVLNDERRDVKNDQTEKIGNNVDVTVGNKVTVDVGTTYELTANMQIKLTVGMSSITITPASIELSSPNLMFTGMATVVTKAPMVLTNADAMVAINSLGMITATAQMTTIVGGKSPLPPVITPLLTVM